MLSATNGLVVGTSGIGLTERMRDSAHAGATSPQVPKLKAGVTIGNKINVFVRFIQGLEKKEMELCTTSYHQVT